MRILKYISFMVVIAISAVFTSCLDDGDDTFALQKGEFEELIHGAWKVKSCKLYDAQTGEYDSDLLNPDNLGSIYNLAEEGSSIEDGNGVSGTLVWSSESDNKTLILNGEYYGLVSLGRGLMVLGRHGVINDKEYEIHYYLYRSGNAGSVSGGENPEPDVPDGDENETVVVSTDGSGTFRRNGYTFKVPTGAVPKGDNDSNGSVAFSVETLETPELPAPAPEGVSFIEGSGILASPSNFTFASPIFINVPLRGNNPSNTRLYKWNALQQRWEIVPFSSINPNGTADVAVLELGYYVLGVTESTQRVGGIKIQKAKIDAGYYYYLTVIPQNGNSSSASVSFTSGGEDLYMANIPLGAYQVQIARERRTSYDSQTVTVEYSTVTTVINVESVLVALGNSYDSYTGWTILDLSNIDWNEGRPSYWGEETVTYGTGTFQATLNWINYSESTTDYDLHLTTPTGKEVYYSNKQADGFELDRDVISDIGNCVENIYSIAESLPAGSYKVRVHHYSGATGREYNCRVIIRGKVVTTYRGITNSGYQDIYSFTLQ